MGPIKVLVAEDEAITARLMERVLRRHDFVVIGPCATGLDAVYATLSHRPHVILMDIRLSGAIDGLEASEVIRKDTDIPIIFLTGYDTDEMRNRAAMIPHTAFLVKPADVNELVAQIHKMLLMVKV